MSSLSSGQAILSTKPPGSLIPRSTTWTFTRLHGVKDAAFLEVCVLHCCLFVSNHWYIQVQYEYRQLRMRVGMGVRVEMRVIVIVRVGR